MGDPEPDLPRDMLVERQVDDAIAAGVPVPRWGWPIPRSYNGFTGRERVLGWQKLRVAQRLGLAQREPICSVCRRADATQDHTELYARPILSMPVCRSCHFRIHRRFFDPGQWHALLRRRAGEADWASSLRTVELDRQEAMRIAAEPDIFASLAKGCCRS